MCNYRQLISKDQRILLLWGLCISRPDHKRFKSELFSSDNDNETIAVQLVENNATLDMRVDNNDRI